jgi:hypothetical protein
VRRLSDPEYVQLLGEYDFSSLQPGQSKVVAFGNMAVLVFDGADGSLYTSDVSDAPQLQAIAAAGYGTTQADTWLDTLPAAMADTIKDDAASLGVLVNEAGQAISSAAASAAADAQKAASAILTPLLIGAVILFGLLYLPKGR